MSLLDEARAKKQAISIGLSPKERTVGLLAEARARKNIDQADAGEQDDSIGRNDSISSDTNSARVGEKAIDSSTLNKIDAALSKIPGVPQLAEFAAGTNRSVAGFLDFLGPDNVNTLLELGGSEARIPTFSEFTAKPGSFVEPGLQQKVLSASGEIAPAALGIGQALRTLAGKLPGFAATESAGAGILRQAGQTTAKQDIAGGVAAGAGQEVGREIGGEPGAMIGSVAAPIALAIPLQSAKATASKLLSKSAPKPTELKDAATAIYRTLDDSGISVPANKFDALADDIVSSMKKEGFDEDLTPQINAIIRRFGAAKGGEKSLGEIDLLRQISRDAGDSLKARERRLSAIATEKIDDFLDGLSTQVDGREAGQAFKSARDLWQRVKKTETLEQALTNAQNQASGFENGIRTQFRQILKKIDTGKLKGYTEEEKEAIRKVVQGTNAGNIAKFLGKFGVLDGVTSRSLTTLGGTGLVGAASGSPIAAAAVPLVGQLSGALAQRMTLNNAKMAKSIVRAGKNGRQIADIYLKNTPKSQRSPSELAELFIKNNVPVEIVSMKTASPIISDAAIIAAIAKSNDAKEGEQE